ncbi:MAG: putative sulfate exporter family transporter [Steroidobacteraceae bacterium]
MNKLPGLLLALVLAVVGNVAADAFSRAIGMSPGAISGIMVAIVLGLAISNFVGLPDALRPGVTYAVKGVLPIGIVLLGLKLSIVEVGAIGLRALPVLLVTIPTAVLVVGWLARRLGLTDRLGTLIAVGTSVCGNTAIVALSPVIGAKEEETSYAVACITAFGLLAMLTYPFVAHALFGGDSFAAGVFLGSAVHDTSQVAAAGMVYQDYYVDPRVLSVATVTKLERNLSMLVLVPMMAIRHHRKSAEGGVAPPWYTMVPLFVVGFGAMAVLRTVGDLGERPFGFVTTDQWHAFLDLGKHGATYCLGIAMAGVGLGTRIADLRRIGFRPLGLALTSALLVGVVSATLIHALY